MLKPFIAITASSFALLFGCGGRGSEQQTDTKPAEECAAYASELQACFAKIGAPARSTDALTASAASPRDEATRAELNAACARERAQLHTSCK
jgi:hypothetical protein